MISGILLSSILFSYYCSHSPAEIKYGVGEWDAAKYGNHRAVVKVKQKADPVRIHLPWRRRDFHPENKNIQIIDKTTGQELTNVYPIRINREFADIVFQPQSGPGIYFIYYMPYTTSGNKHYPTIIYNKPRFQADKDWIKYHQLNNNSQKEANWHKFPEAILEEIQAINKFNSFYPMEIIATRAETKAIIKNNKTKSFLLFPEDRAYPIRMNQDLPLRWIKKGITNHFEGTAQKGEYYTFQVGIFAVKQEIQNISIKYHNLNHKNGRDSISSQSFTCFNLQGTDCRGNTFRKKLPVKKGRIQSLWFGVQIPLNTPPGPYTTTIEIAPQGIKSQKITLNLHISTKTLPDAGDSDPWRHSRLRWLNSRMAIDNKIVPPYKPLQYADNTIRCLGREVTLDTTGFPRSIRSFFSAEMTSIEKSINGKELLSSPVKLLIEHPSQGIIPWQNSQVEIKELSDGIIRWDSESKSKFMQLKCKAQMEFEGYMDFQITLTAKRDTKLKDIRLEIPLAASMAKYMMGMGRKGGYRPSQYSWQWDPKNNQDSVWIGDVNGGLQCSFRDRNYVRPLNTNYYQSKPLNMPPSWYNKGRGGCYLHEQGNNTFLIRSFSGSRSIKTGDKLYFYFSLLITPFKPLDTKSHWQNRFYHRFNPLSEIQQMGANIVNVHHATDINPFINYPFFRPKEMKTYIDQAHKMGMKVKIYYTVRELTNRSPELFALKSLGSEIFSPGPGGGPSWLQEHLDNNYIKGWLVPHLKDAAIINSGVSRWHNYYLEGLNWLTKNIGIDGLYIDDVAFDRTVMKRVRKILDRNQKGALIDLHSANQFNHRDGFANSANLYMEHFPFINRLWFGEYFDYNLPPDFWLIEVSGIPFGLMGEMLQDGGNPWRGMLYSMTARLPWAGDPRPIWKVWDNFGIEDSQMIGYWVPTCPVKTSHKKILATVYIKPDKILVAIASWAKNQVNCRLNIDWKQLDLNAAQAVIEAPEIKDFQEKWEFQINDKIPVEPGKGWLLIIQNINN